MNIHHHHRFFILTRLQEKKVRLGQQGLLQGDQRQERWYLLQQQTQRKRSLRKGNFITATALAF